MTDDPGVERGGMDPLQRLSTAGARSRGAVRRRCVLDQKPRHRHATSVSSIRALLKNPRILIFDEATSSLDAETAEHFAATINQLKGKVTMLFVTHAMPRSLQVDRLANIGLPPGPTRVPDGNVRLHPKVAQ